MSDMEMANLRNVHGQQPQQPRYQHLYSAGNGYWKDRLEPVHNGQDDGRGLIGYDEDGGDEEDDVVAIRSRKGFEEMKELRHPLEVSAVGRQPVAGSSMSSSYYSTHPLPMPVIVSQLNQPSAIDESTECVEPAEAEGINLMVSPDEEFEFPPPRPTRSQVLHYFARAHNFTLTRVEKDMQITDQEGFPLFDAYIEADCCGRTWTIEAYGRLVLVMYEPMNSWCQDLARPRISVRDWNGDHLGMIFVGDTYYLHGNENRDVAKMILHRAAAGITMDDDPSPLVTATNAVVPAPMAAARSSKCWLCVHESTGRHIARLEDYQTIQFNKDLTFQLKLLTLAGIVRLCGQSHLSPASNCIGTVKTILNCCAGF